MRTTLTLDDDVARQLQEKSRRSGTSFKEVVNETLRKGLSRGEKPAAKLPRFEVKAKARGFRAGVDVLRLNQLNDELEMEDFQRKLAAGTAR
ncbi:MAG TPA: CopG family transcriptional regulator [Thermoanaerobaculia bacterium]|nr:CopG family transcriptional regulator [Thermoanaerobaculia bacterium]